MAEIVDAEMDFVSIFRQAERRIKDPSVAQEDIKTFGGGENLFCSALDGCKGTKIAFNEGHLDNVEVSMIA